MASDPLPIVWELRETIHECAPDHSQHIISVGACRQAARLIEQLCDALAQCRGILTEIRMDWSDPRAEIREGWAVIDSALAAAGEQVSA